MKRFLLFAVVALLFVACDNKFEDEGNSLQRVSNLPVLTAGFAEETRTYVEDDKYLRWHEGDLIAAFVGNTLNSKYRFLGEDGDNSGEFEPIPSDNLTTGSDIDRIYAIYPYDAATELTNECLISYNFAATQIYANNSFGKDTNVMAAVTESVDDKFLAFKNVCGYLKVKLYGEGVVKSIVLTGNDGEKIAGAATIAATYGGVPVVAMSDDATDSITLDCGEGVALSADAENSTEFWLTVPPTEFSNGITITVTDANNGEFEQTTTKSVVVNRNEIQPMAALEVEFEVYDPTKPSKSEIWYTSSTGSVIKPNKTDVFGANIVSNTYENGMGVITFDGRVTAIGDKAFNSCSYLTSITIPDSVTTIGQYGFYNCWSLKEMTIPDGVTTIGDYAFCGCSNLQNITIGNSVTTIGYQTFTECKNLTSVTIPDSVTTIGNYAFKKCSKLTSVTVGSGLVTIGERAFEDCTNLTEFLGDNVLKDEHALIVNGVLLHFFDYVASEYSIPDGVTKVAANAFNGCNKLTKITIPDSVITIGDSAFYECYALSTVELGDGLLEIGNDAFYACEKLTKITLPDSLTTIGSRAFASTGLTSISIPNNVTVIETRTFSNCGSLSTVEMGDAVVAIGDYAFNYCSKLVSINIPDSVAEIGEYAFFYCQKLEDIALPASLTSVKDQCFTYCVKAFGDTLIIPDKVESIGWGSFYGVQKPTALILGKGLKTIGRYAFSTCCKITSLTIPSNVKEIKEYAFENCYVIKELIIEDGVESIDQYAFSSLRELTSVEIPASVKSIGYKAFYYCSLLNSFYLKSETPPAVSFSSTWDAFYKCSADLKIYVPESDDHAITYAYKLAPGWSEYADIITTESGDAPVYESTDFSNDGEVITLQTATAGNGIDIVLMGDGYSDRMIANSTYDSDMKKAVKMLFDKEPFRSFKNLFNVYYVTAVSKNEGFASGNTTTFGCAFGDGTSISGDINLMLSYAKKAISEDRLGEATIVTIMKAHRVSGISTLMIPNEATNDYGSGTGVAIVAQGDNDEAFAELVWHEAGGHSFAKLGDEYAYSKNGTAPDSAITIITNQSKYGWLKNIDTTKDVNEVKWKHFINDERYVDEISVYEGGYTYYKGVWRPTQNSIMNSGSGEFNAPSREAIYYRIHKLAYGDEWEYDYEKFVEYDAINRGVEPTQTTALRSVGSTSSPVVITTAAIR